MQRVMMWTVVVEIAKQKAISKEKSVEVNWRELCKMVSYLSLVMMATSAT